MVKEKTGREVERENSGRKGLRETLQQVRTTAHL